MVGIVTQHLIEESDLQYPTTINSLVTIELMERKGILNYFIPIPSSIIATLFTKHCESRGMLPRTKLQLIQYLYNDVITDIQGSVLTVEVSSLFVVRTVLFSNAVVDDIYSIVINI